MDINSLTIDEFDDLTTGHHREALQLYDNAINPLIERLAAVPDKATTAFDTDRDQLLMYLQLRKVHETRLIEMLDEQRETQFSTLPQAA